ncbi:hypothetical protein HHI36_011883 [Cryptolaemus montrouzieri]|uniref:Tc1-like transposase DDE domain-containing protein n=1 Tax=Cryptolaemus montrouzieri TaxID=559131 RepID=A0ABD2ND22_9CUCU
MTAARYIADILEPHVVLFGSLIGENFIYMRDNAWPHAARVVTEFLQNAEIDILRWPATSPDLNPIEYVWDNKGWQIQQRRMSCRTLQQLENLLPEIWIQNLFEGLPRRILAVIRARG